MALSINFAVHAVNIVPTGATVTRSGKETRGVIDVCEVEMVVLDGLHGSFTARFEGDEATEARTRFHVGDAICVPF